MNVVPADAPRAALPGRGTPTVYALLDADAVVLYVGQTINLRNRRGEHRCERLHGWWSKVASIAWVEFPAEQTKADRLAIEKACIRLLHPSFNRRHLEVAS